MGPNNDLPLPHNPSTQITPKLEAIGLIEEMLKLFTKRPTPHSLLGRAQLHIVIDRLPKKP